MYLFSHHMLEEKNRENQHNLKSKIPKTRLVQEQSIRECTESFTTPVLSPSVTRLTLETPHLKLITDLKEPVLKLSKNVMIKKICGAAGEKQTCERCGFDSRCRTNVCIVFKYLLWVWVLRIMYSSWYPNPRVGSGLCMRLWVMSPFQCWTFRVPGSRSPQHPAASPHSCRHS